MEPIEVTVRGVKGWIRYWAQGTYWVRNAETGMGLNEAGEWRTLADGGEPAKFPSPAAAQAFVDKLNTEEITPSPQAAAGETQCSHTFDCNAKSSDPSDHSDACPMSQAVHCRTGIFRISLDGDRLVITDPDAKCVHVSRGHLSTGTHLAMAIDGLRLQKAEQPPAAPDAGVREQTTYRINHDPALLAAFPLEGDAPRLAAELADLTRQLAAANAEIAHLLFGSEMLAALSATQAEQLKAKGAEIERLRGCEINLGALRPKLADCEDALRKANAENERLKVKADSFDALWQVCIECGMEVQQPGIDEDGEFIPEEHACQFGFIRGLREQLTSTQSALAAERERAE